MTMDDSLKASDCIINKDLFKSWANKLIGYII